jgi:hypothetical protein
MLAVAPADHDEQMAEASSAPAEAVIDARSTCAFPLPEPSPRTCNRVRAAAHKARFDCHDAAGDTVPGTAKSVTVAADEATALVALDRPAQRTARAAVLAPWLFSPHGAARCSW